MHSASLVLALSCWAVLLQSSGQSVNDVLAEGLQVISTRQLFYTTSSGFVTVNAGTEGEIVSLSPYLVVLWDVEPQPVQGSVSIDGIEQRACAFTCPGLQEYLLAFDEARMDQSLDQAQKCNALQGHSNTTACLLDGSPENKCEVARGTLQEEAASCNDIGIDVTEVPTPSVFGVTTCRVCSYLSGALTLNGLPIPSRLYEPRAECEEECIRDDACTVYDYQAVSGYCRMWQACPESTRSRGSCSWSIYEKPASMLPEVVEESLVNGDSLQSQSVGIEAQTPSPTPAPTQEWLVHAVASRASPALVPVSSVAVCGLLVYHGLSYS